WQFAVIGRSIVVAVVVTVRHCRYRLRRTTTTTTKKLTARHFPNSAPQSPIQFRVARPLFRYPVNDHTGGFETLPYIGR
ncbi:MAG: hypothetical protein LBB93_03185, partial [Elusimicrobiota bacterium]|nr:hypothetical protein [Elusimicrobiota bacterium]